MEVWYDECSFTLGGGMTVKHSMFVILHKYANAEILSATKWIGKFTDGSSGTGWQAGSGKP
ncbi:MAG: hypothetical protein UZ16_OP3001002812 [Candidatus Hinthialibacteria bacterium OLB16]|nr:MAG: hypothetical protein UZ16_OP3001002812 [Candidatus Hinthialibacteria bacterium OLB16]NUP91965.1 hypothetical protein [Candidatus Omnitrophota bacterium]